MISIRELGARDAAQYVGSLATVLLDCVEGGASVSFMASLTRGEAESFFTKVANDVARGERILLAAFAGSELVGTVQVHLATPPNQPHRADVAKLLVTRKARSRGIAAQLMEAAEEASRRVGRSLLVLDTVTGSPAERLYVRLGWTRVGVIPNYALFPDGRWCDTTVFYKELGAVDTGANEPQS